MKVLACLFGLSTLLGPAAQGQEVDTRTAVLCSQAMLLGTKASAELCKWKRTATDDAIDAALSDIDTFIIKNSSRLVSQDQLDVYEASSIQQSVEAYAAEPGYCRFDPADKSAPAALPWALHTMKAAKLSAWIADDLSVPREPDMNPCL